MKIKRDLFPLKDFEVVLFGSYVEKALRPESDIDVSIITRSLDSSKNYNLWKMLVSKIPTIYDVRIFELLPINVQMSIVQNYQIVYGDKLEISEYFYEIRKQWADCKHRFMENLIPS
jgi:hypothetical protein